MDIQEIKRLCRDETIEASGHFVESGRRRNITYKETKEAIINGEIIEKLSTVLTEVAVVEFVA